MRIVDKSDQKEMAGWVVIVYQVGLNNVRDLCQTLVAVNRVRILTVAQFKLNSRPDWQPIQPNQSRRDDRVSQDQIRHGVEFWTLGSGLSD